MLSLRDCLARFWKKGKVTKIAGAVRAQSFNLNFAAECFDLELSIFSGGIFRAIH